MTPRLFGRIAGVGFLLTLLFASACGAQESPKVRVQPLETYAGLWNLNIECLDRTYGYGGVAAGTVRPTPHTALDGIHWYVAGDSTFVGPDGKALLGLFVPPDTIILAGMLMQNARLVRHEMLHAQGVSYHPLIPFHSCGLFDGLHGGSQR